MQLFIMRHGDASMIAQTDSQRPLTEQGIVEASLMGKWLKGLDVNIEHLLVSPYLRAQQTASVLLSQLDYKPKSKTINIITPSGNAAQVHDYIDGFIEKSHCQQLLMVTHMPLVSYLVEDLTVNQQSPIFQTAAIAQIDYDIKNMKGELVRLISPLEFF
jgi:phosphohistidine phosphatase